MSRGVLRLALSQKPGNPAAMAVFRASLLYLPAVMAALLLDRVPVKHSEEAPAFRWCADGDLCEDF